MIDGERNWRGAGIGFAVLIVIAGFVYGDQPKLGASVEEFVSFHDGDRTRILIATVIFCISFLELLWFFPAATFVMSGAFGLRQAGIISTSFFSAGVLVVVLALLGGTTWARDGLWAPDGAYSLLATLLVLVWIAVLSGFLVRKSSAVKAPDRAAVPVP